MDKLHIKKVSIPAFDCIKLVNEVEDSAPYWFIHGAEMVKELGDPESPDYYIYAIYSESEFIGDDELKELGCEILTSEITPEELKKVERSAALKALRICLVDKNLELLGEGILNKHPEFRTSETIELAIIRAALKEREDNFTDEDYEQF